eukprot:scaffold11.g3934.t1
MNDSQASQVAPIAPLRFNKDCSGGGTGCQYPQGGKRGKCISAGQTGVHCATCRGRFCTQTCYERHLSHKPTVRGKRSSRTVCQVVASRWAAAAAGAEEPADSQPARQVTQANSAAVSQPPDAGVSTSDGKPAGLAGAKRTAPEPPAGLAGEKRAAPEPPGQPKAGGKRAAPEPPGQPKAGGKRAAPEPPGQPKAGGKRAAPESPGQPKAGGKRAAPQPPGQPKAGGKRTAPEPAEQPSRPSLADLLLAAKASAGWRCRAGAGLLRAPCTQGPLPAGRLEGDLDVLAKAMSREAPPPGQVPPPREAPPLGQEELVMVAALAGHLVGLPEGWACTPEQWARLLDAAVPAAEAAAAVLHGWGGSLPRDLSAELNCARCSKSLDVRCFGARDAGSGDVSLAEGFYCWACREAAGPSPVPIPAGRSAQWLAELVELTRRARWQPPPQVTLIDQLRPLVYSSRMRLPIKSGDGVVREALYITLAELVEQLLSCARHSSADKAASLTQAVETAKAGGYAQVNVPYRPDLAAEALNGVMAAMRRYRCPRPNRPLEARFWRVCDAFLDSRAGSGTRPHVDWSEAFNFAVALITPGPEGEALRPRLERGERPVLARWLFIHPRLAQSASQLYKRMGYAAEGFATPSTAKGSSRPRHKQARVGVGLGALPAWACQGWVDCAFFDAVLARFGDVVIEGEDAVAVLEQRAGDCVWVPPGWVHAVLNVQPNVKLAWDAFDWQNMAAYVESEQRIASGVTAGSNARDYMAVASAAAAFLLDGVAGAAAKRHHAR